MNTEKIVIAGDWHLNDPWACAVIDGARLRGCDIVLQLGDFGISPQPVGDDYLDRIQQQAEQSGVLVVVVPGNHEDWDQIERFPTTDNPALFPPQAKWFRKNIAVLPRVASFELGGKRFISLAGAPSLDYYPEDEGFSWWPQERVLPEHVAEVVALGGADYMLAHDSPYPSSPIVNSIVERGAKHDNKALQHAREGRELMTKAFESVAPDVMFHGHYHVRDTGYVEIVDPRTNKRKTSRIESIGTDERPGNVVVLDVATGEVTDYLDVTD